MKKVKITIVLTAFWFLAHSQECTKDTFVKVALALSEGQALDSILFPTNVNDGESLYVMGWNEFTKIKGVCVNAHNKEVYFDSEGDMMIDDVCYYLEIDSFLRTDTVFELHFKTRIHVDCTAITKWYSGYAMVTCDRRGVYTLQWTSLLRQHNWERRYPKR